MVGHKKGKALVSTLIKRLILRSVSMIVYLLKETKMKTLFPKIHEELSFMDMIFGILKTLSGFTIYAIILTVFALVINKNDGSNLNIYNNPLVSWTKPITLIWIISVIWKIYQYSKCRLLTNGYKFPIINLYLFIGSIYYIIKPENILSFIIGMIIFIGIGRKFIYAKS